MEVLFSASIVVGFIAGMIALFAPCCITFLFPAYIGQIVRTRSKVFLGTFIFSLGIATIILPIAIGVKIILSLFTQYHSAVYYFGALLMILFGVLILFGKNLMMYLPRLPQKNINTKNVNGEKSSAIEWGSLYVLGVVSGLSSACCIPVLAVAVVLAGISSTLIQTLLVGLSYVFGMVFPLFIGALFFESNPLQPVKNFLNKRFGAYSFGDLVSAVIFVVMGIWIAILNYQGKIAMGVQSQRINQTIGNLNLIVGGFLSQYRFLDWILGISLFILVYVIVRSGMKRGNNIKNNNE